MDMDLAEMAAEAFYTARINEVMNHPGLSQFDKNECLRNIAFHRKNKLYRALSETHAIPLLCGLRLEVEL
jgi:hypothetical protein